MSTIICGGGMRSGKSDDAMNIVESYHNLGLKYILFQPKQNTRDVVDEKPVWRTGNYNFRLTYASAQYYQGPEQVISALSKYDIVGIEEPHWIPKDELLEVANMINERDKILIVAGLNYFHNGVPVPQMQSLRELKGSVYRQGVQALCQKDLDSGKRTLATRTQMLIDGKYPRFDSPTDLPEKSSERFLDGGAGSVGSTASYYPVSVKNWEVLPPADEALFADYKKYYLDVKNRI